MNSSEFQKKSIEKPTFFKRKATLDFPTLFLFILSIRQSSITADLRTFFRKGKSIISSIVNTVKKSAFSRARNKIKSTAFRDANIVVVNDYYENSPNIKLWHGRRLLSIDGSKVQLPPSKSIWNKFSPITTNEKFKNEFPIARYSCLFDCRNHLVLNSTITAWNQGELSHLEALLKQVKENDLIVLDRGYSSFKVFITIKGKRADVCCRMKNSWNVVKNFVKSKKIEAIVYLSPSQYTKKELVEKGISIAPIKIRLIRVELDNGEIEVLGTTLLGADLFPVELFKSLYHERWGIEECYKLEKSWLQLENFTGLSVKSIEQDFYAKILIQNLTEITATEAKEQVAIKNEQSSNKFDEDINRANSVRVMKDFWPAIAWEKSVKCLRNIFRIMTTAFFDDLTQVRKGRSFSRTTKKTKQRFSMAYKPS